jgi:hypothetical protein
MGGVVPGGENGKWERESLRREWLTKPLVVDEKRSVRGRIEKVTAWTPGGQVGVDMCAALRRADEEGSAYPFFGVVPDPGTALFFWHWRLGEHG